MSKIESSKKIQKGFTLVEILVVVSIIGLLASIAVVGLNEARMRAKDARVKADVIEIRKLLISYETTANVFKINLRNNGGLQPNCYSSSPQNNYCSNLVNLSVQPTNITKKIGELAVDIEKQLRRTTAGIYINTSTDKAVILARIPSKENGTNSSPYLCADTLGTIKEYPVLGLAGGTGEAIDAYNAFECL